MLEFVNEPWARAVETEPFEFGKSLKNRNLFLTVPQPRSTRSNLSTKNILSRVVKMGKNKDPNYFLSVRHLKLSQRKDDTVVGWLNPFIVIILPATGYRLFLQLILPFYQKMYLGTLWNTREGNDTTYPIPPYSQNTFYSLPMPFLCPKIPRTNVTTITSRTGKYRTSCNICNRR